MVAVAGAHGSLDRELAFRMSLRRGGPGGREKGGKGRNRRVTYVINFAAWAGREQALLQRRGPRAW